MPAFVGVMYGLASYAVFFITFLYAIGFVGGFVVPKTIDGGAVVPIAEALVVDVLLLAVFAVQHSVMARPAFKRWWTRVVPPSIERSTYVLFASLALILLFWQWRPMPTVVWSTGRTMSLVLSAVFWLGWVVLLVSTFLINHFELFGLQQVVHKLLGRTPSPIDFRTPLFYRWVRHPIYVGFLLAFWAAPVMTVGHLLFALATTGYILVGIQLEERDLIAHFGQRYRTYREQVGMLWPKGRKAAAKQSM